MLHFAAVTLTCHMYYVCMLVRLYDESLKQYSKCHELNQDALKCVLSAIAHGVAHLHSHQVGHFDIKPSNVLIKWSHARCYFPGTSVVLADFGLTHDFVNNGEYHGAWRGTKYFLSPEMAVLKKKGVLKLGDRVDIYAFGVTMKEVMPSPMNQRILWNKHFNQLGPPPSSPSSPPYTHTYTLALHTHIHTHPSK